MRVALSIDSFIEGRGGVSTSVIALVLSTITPSGGEEITPAPLHITDLGGTLPVWWGGKAQ